MKKEVLGKRNSLNQIIEHEVGDITYPCGIEYEGKHIIKYTYAENGLISHGEIYDEQGKLIIELKYEYETH